MTDEVLGLSRRRATVDFGAIVFGVCALILYAWTGSDSAALLGSYGLLWGTSTAVVTYALLRFTGIAVGAPTTGGDDASTRDASDERRTAGAWGIFSGTALESTDDIAEDTGWLIGRLENVVVLTLVLLNEFTALSIIFAAKAWVRTEDTSSEDTTYYLAGTLVNVTYSIGVGLVTLWLVNGAF